MTLQDLCARSMSVEPDAKRPRPTEETEAAPSSDPTPALTVNNVTDVKEATTSSGLAMSPVTKPAEEPISFVVITNDGTDINFER